jgi:hypothetical protein
MRDTVNILGKAFQKSNYGKYMAPKSACNFGTVVYTLKGIRVIGVPAWKLKVPEFEVCLEIGEFD